MGIDQVELEKDWWSRRAGVLGGKLFHKPMELEGDHDLLKKEVQQQFHVHLITLLVHGTSQTSRRHVRLVVKFGVAPTQLGNFRAGLATLGIPQQSYPQCRRSPSLNPP